MALDPGNQLGVERSWFETGQASRRNCYTLGLAQVGQMEVQAGFGTAQRLLVGVAQINGEHGAVGHDVDQVGEEVDPTDRCHLAATDISRQVAHKGND